MTWLKLMVQRIVQLYIKGLKSFFNLQLSIFCYNNGNFKGENIMEHKEILDDAIARCSRRPKTFGMFSKIYPFTTESIDGYIDHFDLEGKSILTVGSSADQAINAALKGATDITLFDVNLYIKYYYYLKAAAMTALEYDEFDDFFTSLLSTRIMPKSKLNKKLFEKVKKVLRELDPESCEFWDTIYSRFIPDRVKQNLFVSETRKIGEISEESPYLRESEYYKTREKISSVRMTFINGNVLKPQFKGQFDNIWLSNIAGYFNEDNVQEMFSKMSPHLKKGGKMLTAYLYGPCGYKLTEIKNTLRDVQFEEIAIPKAVIVRDVNVLSGEDCALVYKRP